MTSAQETAGETADLRSRIRDEALQMFNAATVQRVTYRDIARALGISPGNLTYHFRKKSDIVDTLIDQFEDELSEILAEIPTLSASMEAHADYLLRQLRVVWRYRFFFNSIGYLASVDLSQKSRFNRLQRRLVRQSRHAYEQLTLAGSVNPVSPPNSLDLVMENFWYLWFSLIRMHALVVPASQSSEKGFARFAAMHLYAFLEPYYTDDVKRGFYEHLSRRLR